MDTSNSVPTKRLSAMNHVLNLYIVEDSELIQNRLVQFIQDIPDVHLIGMAADTQNAFNGIINSDTDAIIMDVQLKDGNSFQLLRKVKAQKPALKVVVLTNHATDANRLHALRAGADRFLDKSTDFEQIPRLLHDWQIDADTKRPN